MVDYVQAVKRAFRDQHGFTPTGGTLSEPLFESLPDGIYQSVVNGETDFLVVKDNGLSFLNNTRADAVRVFNKIKPDVGALKICKELLSFTGAKYKQTTDTVSNTTILYVANREESVEVEFDVATGAQINVQYFP